LLKISYFNNKCIPIVSQILYIINGVCHQRNEKRLEQQKRGRPNVNVCAAEENVEEEL